MARTTETRRLFSDQDRQLFSPLEDFKDFNEALDPEFGRAILKFSGALRKKNAPPESLADILRQTSLIK